MWNADRERCPRGRGPEERRDPHGYEAEITVIQDLYLDGKKDEAAAMVPFMLRQAAEIMLG